MPLVERDAGLGTLYERRAVYRLLDDWTAGRPASTALEGPHDGVAGMPGLHLLPLARRGAQVTVCHPEPRALEQAARVYDRCGLLGRLEAVRADAPPRDRTFDVVLSFNALPLVDDWRRYLADLMACTGGVLVLVVTNPFSYGALLARLRRRSRRELFDHPATRPALLLPELTRHARVLERRHVDCPWWPDLFVPAGESLLGALLGLPHHGARPSYDAESFPSALIDPRASTEWTRRLRWHPSLEGRPAWGRLFGHHLAYLARPDRRELVGHADPSPTQRKPAPTPRNSTP